MSPWRVKELAEQRDMSDYRLAKDSGVTYAAVWNIWNNKTTRADLDTLAKLARVLQVQPRELIGDIDLGEGQPA